MANVSAKFHMGNRTKASFDGVVDPDGAEGYVFSGTVKATCMLDRSSTGFKNKVILGHSGRSVGHTDLELYPEGAEENVIPVEGRGRRAKNEKVEFLIGMNTGLSGQMSFGETVYVAPGGPPQKISLFFTKSKFNVSFEGTAWADGPTGYVIQGQLIPASSTTDSYVSEYGTFGYKPSGGSWQYETTKFREPKQILIRGSRKEGADLSVIVGNTTGSCNTYKYGDESSLSLPLEF